MTPCIQAIFPVVLLLLLPPHAIPQTILHPTVSSLPPTSFPTFTAVEKQMQEAEEQRKKDNEVSSGQIVGLVYVCLGMLAVAFPMFNVARRQKWWTYPFDVDIFRSTGWINVWVFKLWAIDDDRIYTAGGLDALMFLRFQRLCVRLFLFCSLWACLLVPLYFYDPDPQVIQSYIKQPLK